MVKLKCTLGSGREAAEMDGGRPSPSSPPPPSGRLRMLGVGLSVPGGLGPEWPWGPRSMQLQDHLGPGQGRKRQGERGVPLWARWLVCSPSTRPRPPALGHKRAPTGLPQVPPPSPGAVRSFWRPGPRLAGLEAWRLHAQPGAPPEAAPHRAAVRRNLSGHVPKHPAGGPQLGEVQLCGSQGGGATRARLCAHGCRGPAPHRVGGSSALGRGPTDPFTWEREGVWSRWGWGWGAPGTQEEPSPPVAACAHNPCPSSPKTGN